MPPRGQPRPTPGLEHHANFAFDCGRRSREWGGPAPILSLALDSGDDPEGLPAVRCRPIRKNLRRVDSGLRLVHPRTARVGEHQIGGLCSDIAGLVPHPFADQDRVSGGELDPIVTTTLLDPAGQDMNSLRTVGMAMGLGCDIAIDGHPGKAQSRILCDRILHQPTNRHAWRRVMCLS